MALMIDYSYTLNEIEVFVKETLAKHGICDIIRFPDNKNHLWLTWKNGEFRVAMNPYAITISRVEFSVDNRRKHIFTEIMHGIENKAAENDICKVIMQCVISYSMYSWCNKNGYIVDEITAFRYPDEDHLISIGNAPVSGDYVKRVMRKDNREVVNV